MMNLSSYLEATLENPVLESNVPDAALSEPCCMGIDEAGRGPVLGPMVYGICYSPIKDGEKLANLGVADSKTLTEETREKLFSLMEENKEMIGWMVHILSPTMISNNMLKRSKFSLNAISHETAINLVKRVISKGINLTELYADTVGDAKSYQDKLQSIFPDIKVTVTPKADSKFPIVSAASICAKVARDNIIKNWKFLEGEFSREYGSGYPSDPEVKRWLREVMDPVFGYPQLVRFSWSTAGKLLDENAKMVSWDDDEEIDEAAKGTAPITSFFKGTKRQESIERHQYLKERHLEQMLDL